MTEARILAAQTTRADPMRQLLSRLHIDPYIAGILGMVALASALPAQGAACGGGRRRHGDDRPDVLPAGRAAGAAGGAGRRAALAAACRGAASTFLLFPALGLTGARVAPGLLTPPLWAGLLMLCVLPSTVQSSIAFTSIARGNVPAALCAATASNLFGILLTPLLAGLLLSTHGGFSARGVGDIVLQLLLPFVAGQLARPGSAPGSAATSAWPAWSTAARSCSSSTSRSARA